ncbi:MAG: hypothetical protein AAF628_04140 [Planctomycetota bacterium]
MQTGSPRSTICRSRRARAAWEASKQAKQELRRVLGDGTVSLDAGPEGLSDLGAWQGKLAAQTIPSKFVADRSYVLHVRPP